MAVQRNLARLHDTRVSMPCLCHLLPCTCGESLLQKWAVDGTIGGKWDNTLQYHLEPEKSNWNLYSSLFFHLSPSSRVALHHRTFFLGIGQPRKSGDFFGDAVSARVISNNSLLKYLLCFSWNDIYHDIFTMTFTPGFPMPQLNIFSWNELRILVKFGGSCRGLEKVWKLVWDPRWS